MYRIPNPLEFRQRIRTKFPLDNPKLATNLEKAIFNYAIQEATKKKIIKKWENPFFSQLYTDRLRTIHRNLNKEIIAALESGELSPQQFAFMTHQEMNPERWADLIQQKVKRDASKFNTNIEASTDMYTSTYKYIQTYYYMVAYTCNYTYTYTCTYTCTYVYAYSSTYTYSFAYKYTLYV
jgi:hypothetical protein